MTEQAADPPGDTPHWTDDFEGLRSDENFADIKQSLTKYDDADNPVEAALKGAHEAQKLLGDPSRMPESFEALDDEQKAALMTKVAKMHGVPDSADGYELTRPDLPEGMPYDEAAEQSAKAYAVENKVRPAVLQGFYDIYNKMMVDRYAAQEKAKTEAADKAVTSLKTDWGGEANTKENMELVHRLLMTYGGNKDEEQEALVKCVDETGLGNMVPLVKALHRIAEQLVMEGRTLTSSQTGASKSGGTLDYPSMDK